MRNPNKLHHIFAKRGHNLGPLVQQYGSREAAAQAVQEVVDLALHAGKLIPNAQDVFETTLDIGGHSVTVRFVILQGAVELGTAFIRPHPWGWPVEPPNLRKASRRLVDLVFLPPLGHGDYDA
jgi:hypothetical protein